MRLRNGEKVVLIDIASARIIRDKNYSFSVQEIHTVPAHMNQQLTRRVFPNLPTASQTSIYQSVHHEWTSVNER